MLLCLTNFDMSYTYIHTYIHCVIIQDDCYVCPRQASKMYFLLVFCDVFFAVSAGVDGATMN